MTPTLKPDKSAPLSAPSDPIKGQQLPLDAVGAKPLDSQEANKLADIAKGLMGEAPSNNPNSMRGLAGAEENQSSSNSPKSTDSVPTILRESFKSIKGLQGFLKDPKKSGVSGVIIIILFAVAYFGYPLLGPLKILHLSSQLQNLSSEFDSANQITMSKLYFYAKTGNYGRTKLGVLANIHANHIDAELAKSGISVKAKAGNVGVWTIDYAQNKKYPMSQSDAIKSAEANSNAAKAAGATVDYKPGSTAFSIEHQPGILGKSVSEARLYNKGMVDLFYEKGKLATWLAARNVNKQQGLLRFNMGAISRVDGWIFDKAKGAAAKAKEPIFKYLSEKLTIGKKPPPTYTSKPAADDSPDERARASGAQADANDINATKEGLTSGKNTFSDYTKKATVKGGAAAGLFGVVCMAKNLIDTAQAEDRAAIITSAMELSNRIKTLDSEMQAESDLVNADGIGVVLELFETNHQFAKQATGTIPPESSRLLNHLESGGENTSGATLPDRINPNAQQTPLAIALSEPPIPQACEVLANPIIAAALAIPAAVSTAVQFVVVSAVSPSIIETLRAEPYDPTKAENTGGVNLELAAMGGFFTANMLHQSAGGMVVAPEDSAKIEQFYASIEQPESSKDKYFDVANYNSVTGKIASKIYSTNKEDVIELPQNILKNTASMLTGKKANAYSASLFKDVTYGEPIVRITPKSLSFETPSEPAVIAQQVLSGPEGNKYKEILKKCNNIDVVDESTELDFKFPEKPPYFAPNNIPKECMSSSEDDNLAAINATLNNTMSTKYSLCYLDTTELGKKLCEEIGMTSQEAGNATSGSPQGIASGEKSELINKILDNPRIKLMGTDPAEEEIKNKLQLGALIGLASLGEKTGVDIPVTDLWRDWGDDFHGQGQALDIGYYGNGQGNWRPEGDKVFKYLYDNRVELKVNELIWWKPPEGYNNLDEGKPHNYDDATNNQHYHHIHVSFDNP